MGVTTTNNKPLNPRGNDQSPLAYNRAKLFSGKALSFDGVNDYVDIGSFSMSGNNATFVFNYNQDAAASSEFVFDNEGARVSIGQGDVSGSFGIDTGSIAWKYFGSLESNKWYGISITIEGSTAKCYANGVPFGDAVDIGETLNFANVTNATIGARYSKTAANFNGQIAGFKIFNTALTAAQVADLYNNPELVVPTGVDNTALKLWLPMQEGAGTTAYDGSGNNLGSEEVTNGDFATDSDWTKESGWTISGGKATFDGSAATNALYQNIGGVSGTKYLLSFEVTDYVSGSVKAYLSNGDVSASTPSINANGKYVFDITATGVLCLFRNETSFNGSIDNVSVKELTSYGAISGATWTHGIGAPVAQTSVIDWNKWTLDGSNDILIPQGLTSGRDLLGNLFENVRKQGALNLDGNSWAEVHDNGSLDFGTGSFSLEAWVRVKFVAQGSSYNVVMTLGGNLSSQGTSGLIINSSKLPVYAYSNNLSGAGSISEGTWIHMVGVYNETNATIYVNGSQVDQDARTAANITNTLVKQIGRDSTSNRYYNDQIAQPRIYNRALTAEEVQRNYNAGKNTYTNS